MANHEFVPTKYYRTLGTHEPVMTVRSGDVIVTSTVNAAGEDHTGRKITEGGNPQTGPFYVTGAEPGDVLEVEICRITPTGDSGFTYDVLAPNVVNPDRASELPRRERLRWSLDHANATARPDLTSLVNLRLDFEPMIGLLRGRT